MPEGHDDTTPVPSGGRNAVYRKHLVVGLVVATLVHVVIFSLYEGGAQVISQRDPVPVPLRITRYVELEPPDVEGEEGGGGGSTMLLAAGPQKGDGVRPQNLIPVPEVSEKPADDEPGARDSIPADQIPPNAITDAGVNQPAGQGEGGFGPGSGGGYGGGTGGGIGSGTGKGTGTGPEKQPPARISIRMPHPVRFVEPEYPREAHRRRIYAEVGVEVTVDEQGHVIASHVVKRTLLDKKGRPKEEVVSIGYGIEEAALAAVSRWQFVPGRRNDVPFEASTTVTIRFTAE